MFQFMLEHRFYGMDFMLMEMGKRTKDDGTIMCFTHDECKVCNVRRMSFANEIEIGLA